VQTAYESKLQSLNRGRKGLALRFAQQQMNVFGHDDISQYDKTITAANAFECPQEEITAPFIVEQWLAPVATERDEM
jgi:hypothetical protein